MSRNQPRGVMVTLFGVVGTLAFAFLALEYVLVRVDALAGLIVLPAPWGLEGVLQALPAWAGWAITATIWLGLLGALLLLLRDRSAVFVLSLAFIASLVTLGWGVSAMLDGQMQLVTIKPLEYTAALGALCFGLWLYARTAKRYGGL